MTSNSKKQAKTAYCYVYITLPGAVQAVTAGRYELTADRRGTPLGKFLYGRSYVERPEAVDIDPVELRLARARLYETALNDGVFGSLRDASPDHWGRLVIQKALRVATPTELDYLLQSADDRAGALSFGLNVAPPAPRRQFNKTLRLKELQAISLAILREKKELSGPEVQQVRKLLLEGSSLMGGARPKAVVEDDEGLWIAKFNRPNDPWNMARVEHALLLLARDCGISVAESKLALAGRRDVLLVKRFDREKTKQGYLRHRMVSALTLLRAEDSVSDRAKWSYPQLVEELRRVSASPKKDAEELFRRMCFNALVSNLDDHPRNHAVVAMGKGWRLSPAYDITPSRSISQDHRDLAMTVGDFGRYASEQNLVSQCRRFLLSPEDARAIVGDMQARVRATWHRTARKATISLRDCKAIEGAFVYEGFAFVLQPPVEPAR
jgi:serine/threonine-protein kinase HipA